MKVSSRGFSLVELMAVVTILAILSTLIYANFNKAREQSRDAERKSDLRNIQSALELYKQKYGRYPAGCNGATSWSGQKGTAYECPSGSAAYIVSPGTGFPALAPEFIPTLPTDPRLNCPSSGSCDKGYVYIANAEGSVYKIMAKKTVESEQVTMDHPFESCDISSMGGVACVPPVSGRTCDFSICDRVYTGSTNLYGNYGNKPNECDPSNNQFRTTYGLWGGYALASPTLIPNTQQHTVNIERLTEAIVCKI